jgi:NADH:ubiquinone oxidoreductase subunit 5 (subunit L)/multisubunit Na+/H+ antiporter MnhA subunit
MERKRDLSWLRHWRVLTLCGGCLFAGFLLGMLIFGSPWHLPPAWGDIPTWITALATIGLLVGAIFTAIYAIKAFGKQSEQLKDQKELNAKQTEVLDL